MKSNGSVLQDLEIIKTRAGSWADGFYKKIFNVDFYEKKVDWFSRNTFCYFDVINNEIIHEHFVLSSFLV